MASDNETSSPILQKPFQSTTSKKWLDNYNLLLEYQTFCSVVPTRTNASSSKVWNQLRSWVDRQRMKYWAQQKNPQKISLEQWQIDCLTGIEPTIFDGTWTKKHQRKPSKKFMFFIKKIRPDKSIQKFKYSFAQYKKPYVRSPTKSFWEHMIKALFRKEIKFDDCHCSSPYGTKISHAIISTTWSNNTKIHKF